MWRSVTNGEVISGEGVEFGRPDEQVRVVVNVSSAPVRDASGTILAAVGVYDDITELKSLARQRTSSWQPPRMTSGHRWQPSRARLIRLHERIEPSGASTRCHVSPPDPISHLTYNYRERNLLTYSDL